jgi:predicted amidohydrolase YtcJ
VGTLEPGRLADMTVTGRDLLAIDPMEILEAGVVATVVGGRLAWRAASL